MPRSISSASRPLIAFNSTPIDGATAWIAPNCPVPYVVPGSRKTAACVVLGAISFSSSQPLSAAPIFEQRKASGVTARRQAVDEAVADRIEGKHKYDRHGAACLQQRAHGRGGR